MENNRNNQPNNNNKGDNNNGKKQLPVWLICLGVALLLYLLFSYMTSKLQQASYQEISYAKFLEMVQKNEVKEVLIQYDYDRMLISPKVQKEGTLPITYYTGIIQNDDALVPLLNEHGVAYASEVIDKSTTILDVIVNWVLPFALIYLVMWFLFRMLMKGGNGMMGVGKSNAKVYVEKETGVTFKDVAGQEEAKESVTELVDFLHNPGKYTKIPENTPKSVQSSRRVLCLWDRPEPVRLCLQRR